MTVEVAHDPGSSTIELRIPPRLELADAEVYLQAMADALEGPERFGCIFTWVDGRPRKSREANRREHDWLKARRTEVAQRCFGIAMISTPSLAGRCHAWR